MSNLDGSQWILIILAVPTTVLVMVAVLKGYNVHFTRHRIKEQDDRKLKDKEDKE